MRGGKLYFGVLALGLLSCGGSVFAAVINPSFENVKVDPWQTTGAVGLHEVFQGAISPTDGNTQIVAQTNRFAPKTIKPIQLFETTESSEPRKLELFERKRRQRKEETLRSLGYQKKLNKKEAVASTLALSMFFGTDLHALAGGGKVHDGSGFRQTFVLDQTSLLSFDWALGHRTSEPTGNDIAFVVLDGEVYLLTQLYDVVFSQWAKHKYIVTDWMTFEELPELGPGEHTIAFGIINLDTGSGRTALMVDNIQINPVIVPEPATATLGLLGAAGLLLRRRR